MKFKRLMALAMAGIMTLAMAGSVMADDAPVIPEDGKVISKTVKVNDGVSLTKEKTITFNMVQNAANEETREDINRIAPSYLSTTLTVTSNNIAEEIKAAIDTAMFPAVGVYNLVLTEADPKDNDGWRANTDGSYLLRVYVMNKDGDKEYRYAIYKGTTVSGEKLESANFTNVYAPISGDSNTGSLTVKKTVSNPSASAVTSYNFEVTFTDGAAGTLEEDIENAVASVDKGSAVPSIVTTPAGEGKPAKVTVTFALKDGETFKIAGLPQGIAYTVAETDDTATYGKQFKQTTISSKSGNLAKEVTAVDVKNEFVEITPTGLAISVAPFIAMFAAVGAAIALYVAAKRRVR